MRRNSDPTTRYVALLGIGKHAEHVVVMQNLLCENHQAIISLSSTAYFDTIDGHRRPHGQGTRYIGGTPEKRENLQSLSNVFDRSRKAL